jgi:hypothetical protein
VSVWISILALEAASVRFAHAMTSVSAPAESEVGSAASAAAAMGSAADGSASAASASAIGSAAASMARAATL